MTFAVLSVYFVAYAVAANARSRSPYSTEALETFHADMASSGEAPHYVVHHPVSFLTTRRNSTHEDKSSEAEGSVEDAVGGFAGGFLNFMWIFEMIEEALTYLGEKLGIPPLWSPRNSDKNKSAQGHSSKDVPPEYAVSEDSPNGTTLELPQPALERLHELALTAVALSDFEEDKAKLDGNITEMRIEHAEERKAIHALSDITNQINTSLKEPMASSEGDFRVLQDVLSEGDTAEFVTAEAAAANNALVTANDVARVQSGKAGSRLRGEDLGPRGDLNSFQGDMIPASPKQMSLFQAAPKDSVAAGASWIGGKVKFCFASDVSAHVKHIFLAAANQFHVAVPCLEFVDVGWASGSSSSAESEQKCQEGPAIFVQSNPNEGCYSYVGMVTSKDSQKLQLQEPGCLNIGTAIHELGHALGMAHEQARPDRDEHVKIHWENIQHGTENNFEIEEKAHVALQYDLLSVMHYDRFAFTTDPKRPTIETVGEHSGSLGQRSGLSSFDVQQLEDMYKTEVKDCVGNALAGMGCIDKPDDSGKDVCNITQCSSVAAKHCCACGGGLQVQCYQGQACPKTEALPDMQARDCIEDATAKFAGQGFPCVYTNVCQFNVEFKCPDLNCAHKVPSKAYAGAQCNGNFQTKICTAKTECTVYRI